MANIEILENETAWTALWSAQAGADAGLLLVVKLSPICPVSHQAEAQFKASAESLAHPNGLHIASVDVVHRRPVSQQIAADTGVQHESPQALLIGSNQEVLWQASHFQITEETLRGALQETGGS